MTGYKRWHGHGPYILIPDQHDAGKQREAFSGKKRRVRTPVK